MKLPSLRHLAAEAVRVVRRFPLTLLCSFILCGVGLYVVYLNDYREEQKLDWLFPVLSTAGLGLSFTLAVALTAERYRWQPAVRWGAQAGALALLGLWYALVPAQPDMTWGIRLALLLLGLHLAVAAGPYLSELRRQADTPGFWRYNETLFLRILMAGLYSGVLYVGCALALVAIENLFDVKLDHRWYGYLFVALSTVFNTWFFLAGMPQDFEALEQEATYPKALKLFTQFVLLPLVVLYLVILYAYLGRIVVQWELPKGWVSVLILVFSVAGIFALLLIHPIRQAAENTWIRTFARWFYRALFPLLALLAVAIGTRIRAYGITEERYFVLVLAAWLFGMAAYFLVRRGQGIIWIPASLAVVAFLSVGGPWGAFAVARGSQLRQLREISSRYRLLQNGKLDGAGKRASNLPQSVRKRLSSIFDFFADRQALQELQPFFAASISPPDSLRQKSSWARKYWLRNRLEEVTGIAEYNEYAEEVARVKTANFQPTDFQVWPLGQGRYLLNDVDLTRYRQPAEEAAATFTIPEGTFRLWSSGHGRRLQLQQQVAGQWQPQLTLRPGTLTDSLTSVHGTEPAESVELPAAGLTLRAANRRFALRLLLRQLNREQHQDSVKYNYEAQALLEIQK